MAPQRAWPAAGAPHAGAWSPDVAAELDAAVKEPWPPDATPATRATEATVAFSHPDILVPIVAGPPFANPLATRQFTMMTGGRQWRRPLPAFTTGSRALASPRRDSPPVVSTGPVGWTAGLAVPPSLRSRRQEGRNCPPAASFAAISASSLRPSPVATVRNRGRGGPVRRTVLHHEIAHPVEGVTSEGDPAPALRWRRSKACPAILFQAEV